MKRRSYRRSDDTDVLDLNPFLISGLYLVTLLLTGLTYLFLHYYWGSYMQISIHQLTHRGVVAKGLGSVWLLFAWGAAVTSVLIFGFSGRRVSYTSKTEQLLRGWWLSLNAGVFEEIIYRIFIFLCAMVTLPFFNFITLGLFKWFYGTVLVPLANAMTFHALQPWLHHGHWYFGAAIVSASVAFRDATHISACSAG